MNLVAPNATPLMERLQRENTPCFTTLVWGGSTGSPGTMKLSVDVFNPDPVARSSLYVHVFIGPANLAAYVGQAVALVDARIPRLTQPETFGLYIDPEDSAMLDFDIAVPANIERSNYLGNCFLFRAEKFIDSSGAVLGDVEWQAATRGRSQCGFPVPGTAPARVFTALPLVGARSGRGELVTLLAGTRDSRGLNP